MNKIMMNISKTECVHFSCQNVEPDSLVVQYLDNVITSEDHAKFLGKKLYFAQKCTFSQKADEYVVEIVVNSILI